MTNAISSTLLSPSVAVNARPIVLTYHVARPSGFHDRAAWPLLIILHGRGERGKSEKIKQNCLTDEILAVAANRLILVAPECPRDTAWPQLTHYLDAWLDQFAANPENRVDAKSVYLTGYSMGGFGALVWGSVAPHRFAALAPLCSGGGGYWLFDLDPSDDSPAAQKWNAGSKHTVNAVKRFQDISTRLYHGKEDKAHPISDSMIIKDQMSGPNHELVEMDGDHKIWPDVYTRRDFFDWLLTHRQK